MEIVELDELGKHIQEMLNKYADEFPGRAERAVIRSAEHLLPILEARSPKRTGEFARSWKINKFTKLPNIKIAYLVNTDKTEKYGKKNSNRKANKDGKYPIIPTINLIEGSAGNPWKGAKPFVRQTVREEADRVEQIFWQELNGMED